MKKIALLFVCLVACMLVGCSRDYRSYEPKEVIATAVALSLSGEASQEASLVLSLVGFSCDFDKNKRVHHCEYGDDEEIRLFWSPFDENASYFWNKELYGFLGAYYHNPEVTNYYSGSLSLISGDDHDSYITGFFGRLYSWAIMLYGNSIVNWFLGDDGSIPESVNGAKKAAIKQVIDQVKEQSETAQSALEVMESDGEKTETSPEETEAPVDTLQLSSSAQVAGIEKEPKSEHERKVLNSSYYYIEASSTKEDRDNELMYDVSNLRDSDINTFWACHYYNEVYLTFTVKGSVDDPVRVYGISIANGNQKKYSLYKRNSRASIISVYLGGIDDDKLIGRFSFEDLTLEGDDIEYNDVEFDDVYKISENAKLFVTFDEVHEGSNWNDLYLTEANLLGTPSVD